MHGENLIVGLRIHKCVLGHDQLRAHQQRQKPRNEKEDQAGDDEPLAHHTVRYRRQATPAGGGSPCPFIGIQIIEDRPLLRDICGAVGHFRLAR
jgi:hypothetical protein